MRKRTFLILLFVCTATLTVFAQTTSGTLGTTAQNSAAVPAETYTLKLTQKVEFTALVQTRYQLFEDTMKIDAFDLRRARLIFKGDVAPKFGYRFQAEMANGPKVLDAVFTFKPFEYFNVNVGQSKTPYSYDNYYSPYTLLSISRTQIDNALSNRESDLYGNNQGRDIGLWLTGKYSIGAEDKKRPVAEYIFGVYNGSGINVSDNNEFKDFGAALRLSPVKDLWISGRAYHGLATKLLANADSTADRMRLGGDITYKYKSFLVEAEYMTAQDNGAGSGNLLERSGYYFTLGYTPVKDKLQVIARLDSYDKDLNTDLNVVDKYIIAGSWYFSKTTRIQLEYNLVTEEDSDNPINNNLFAIQFQAGF